MTMNVKRKMFDGSKVNQTDEQLKIGIEKFNDKHRTVGCLCDNEPSGNNADLSKVSHTLNYLQLINGYVVADITILDTPIGKIIQELVINSNENIDVIAKVYYENENIVFYGAIFVNND